MDIGAESLMRYRTEIGADAVLVLADIQVKYARMLETRTLSRSAELARERGADAIVVTGTVTGEPQTVEQIQQAQVGAGRTPVLIGSGSQRFQCAGALTGRRRRHRGHEFEAR